MELQQIQIERKANQEFTFKPDGDVFKLRIYEGEECMLADISLNDKKLVLGKRITPNSSMLEFSYLQTGGDFAIITQNNEYPDWREFGITQFLYYVR